MGNGKQTGKRFQLILLQVKRNKNAAITELITLQDYFKNKQGENYKILGEVYGSPKNSLVKICGYYIDHEYLENPVKTLYEINKLFMDSGLVKSITVADMAVTRDVEKIGEGLLKMAGYDLKKQNIKRDI